MNFDGLCAMISFPMNLQAEILTSCFFASPSQVSSLLWLSWATSVSVCHLFCLEHCITISKEFKARTVFLSLLLANSINIDHLFSYMFTLKRFIVSHYKIITKNMSNKYSASGACVWYILKQNVSKCQVNPQHRHRKCIRKPARSARKRSEGDRGAWKW